MQLDLVPGPLLHMVMQGQPQLGQNLNSVSCVFDVVSRSWAQGFVIQGRYAETGRPGDSEASIWGSVAKGPIQKGQHIPYYLRNARTTPFILAQPSWQVHVSVYGLTISTEIHMKNYIFQKKEAKYIQVIPKLIPCKIAQNLLGWKRPQTIKSNIWLKNTTSNRTQH